MRIFFSQVSFLEIFFFFLKEMNKTSVSSQTVIHLWVTEDHITVMYHYVYHMALLQKLALGM